MECSSCDVSSSPIFDNDGVAYVQVFNFGPTCVRFAIFDDWECGLYAVLSAKTTVTIMTNENEIKMKNKNALNE